MRAPFTGLVTPLFALAAILSFGCNDILGPSVGALDVTVSTTGVDVDTDGYIVTVAGTVRQVANNASVVFTGIPPGEYPVVVDGVDPNCSVTGNNQLTLKGERKPVAPDKGVRHRQERGFGKFVREKNAPVLAVYDVGNLEEIKKYNSITVDGEGRITFFEEKPKNPTSTITGIALYYYPKATLALIKQYMAEGNNPDQPGRLVQWLYPRTPFYTWRVPGIWYDIGSKETLEEANKIYAGK